jgi:hypothetical protein
VNQDIAALLDEKAIVDVTIAYCWALDNREWEKLSDVFLPDSTARLGIGEQRNRAEIIERISTALGPLDDSQHMVNCHQVVLDGDRATSRCYLQAQHIRRSAEGGANYIVAGRYEDQWVRTTDGWRIMHRQLIVMWTDGNQRVVRPSS